MIKQLRLLNPELKILTTAEKSALYEKVEGDFSEIIAMSAKLKPNYANDYIPKDIESQKTAIVNDVESTVFGELPVQAGWCFGGNPFMNGMEWHKTSEVVVACTDAVLLLGSFYDVDNDTYDSAKAIGLYIKKGEAVELKPMTLHYAPLPVGEYFKVAIILPQGTNLPLTGGIKGAKRAVNKWLLVHPENAEDIKAGGKQGIVGDNIKLKR